jgi:hypothetical protein
MPAACEGDSFVIFRKLSVYEIMMKLYESVTKKPFQDKARATIAATRAFCSRRAMLA